MTCVRFALAVAAPVLAAAALRTSTADAQPAPPNAIRQVSGEEELPKGYLFIPNREFTRRLEAAAMLIDEGNYDDGLELLQKVIDSSEDFFFFRDLEKRGQPFSQKAEAMRLLAELPRDGRETYELKYGRPARQRLDEAVREGNVAVVEEIARRFFHSQAGYEAVWLLGSYDLDRSRPLAAALRFEQLRQVPQAVKRWEPMLSLKTALCWARAEFPKQAAATLVELKEAARDKTLTLAGRRVPLFARDDEALSWLTATFDGGTDRVTAREGTWMPLFRGDPARTAVSSQTSPVWDDRWQLATIDSNDARNDDPARQSEIAERIKRARLELHRLEARYRKDNLLTLPASHPLVVDGLVVFRTLQNVRAVDLKTGELRWETIGEDSAYNDIVEENKTTSVPNNFRHRTPNAPSSLEALLSQRSWSDLTFGTLGSDGKYVFAIEELGFVSPHLRSARGPLPQGNVAGLKDSNILRVFELSSGKLVCQIGGENDDHALKLAGTYFLGPPLPLGGQLFCLVESSGEIRMLVLRIDDRDPSHIRVEPVWSQQLAQPEHSIETFPLRRMAGLSPSYSNGVMVCPTAAGAVVAVDLSRQILLWGYRYPTISPQENRNRNPFARPGGYVDIGTDDEDRWLDSAPMIASGRVVLTPRDSNELHCVSLIDGSQQWKRPRGQALYVAGVHDGKVVVVGRSRVEAFHLDDGEPAWSEPTPIPMPSGRGVLAGRYYHLPLSTGEPEGSDMSSALGATAGAGNHFSAGEVATVDLETGRIVARSTTRSGSRLGNLVSADGTIVSQSADALIGFKPLDELRQDVERDLENDPDDPTALALRGEMRLHGGDESRGLADLRRSLDGSHDPRVAGIVVSTFLEGMRLEFGKYRDRAPEIEPLIQDPRQRAAFLRMHAAGLHKIGEHRAALSEFLKLAGPNVGPPERERTGGLVTVRSDRWVQSRIAEIYRSAPTAQRAGIEREFRAQLDQALKADGPEPLRKFIQCFLGLPIADDARRALIARLHERGDALELEFVLHELRRSPDPAVSGDATARLVPLLLEHGWPQAAADLVDELENEWANIACLNGKTGRQLAEEWRNDEQIGRTLAEQSPWPDRQIAVKHEERRGSSTRNYAIEFDGPRGPYFQGWSFVLDHGRKTLVARDGMGVERWRLDTGSASPYSNYGSSVRAHGHLLVAALTDQFLVIDTIGGEPKVLWRGKLREPSAFRSSTRGVQVRRIMLPGGGARMVITDQNGEMFGKVGPLTGNTIVYQSGSTLYAADPLTGDVLWERRNVRRGSRLFGDDDFVFVVSGESAQAIVLRASDGEQVGVQAVPSADSELLTIGRHVLSWEGDGNKLLALTDASTGRIRWKRSFPASARVALVGGDEVAVVEPKKGRFAVLAVADGSPRLDAEIETDDGLSQFVVRRSRERYVLLTYNPTTRREGNVNAVALDYYSPLVSGYVYGFDRGTGRRIWTGRVEQQSIDTSQPENLPVIVMATRLYETVQPGRAVIRPSHKLSVAVLDTRNGRVIFEHAGDIPNTTYGYDMTVDPAEKRIDLRFARLQVELSLSDKPLDPPDGP